MNVVVNVLREEQDLIDAMDDPRARDFFIALDELQATLVTCPGLKQLIEVGEKVAVNCLSRHNPPQSFVEDMRP